MASIEYELVSIAEELAAMRQHRKSLEEQKILRDEINEQKKSLAQMRQYRERQETDKLTQPKSFQSGQTPEGKWFGNDKMPTEAEILNPKNRAEIIRELDDFLKRNRTG